MSRETQRAAKSVMIRRVCALAGLFTLFVQGSSGGHMLLVEHSRCAEHGELVHGHASQDLAADTDEQARGRAFETGHEEAANEGHVHCALSANHRDVLAVIVEAQLRPEVVETAQRLVVERADLAPQSKPFRIAPKNSPPA